MVSQGQSLGRRVLVAVAATVALVLALGSNAAVAKGPGPERIVGGVPTTIAEWPWQTAIVEEGARQWLSTPVLRRQPRCPERGPDGRALRA